MAQTKVFYYISHDSKSKYNYCSKPTDGFHDNRIKIRQIYGSLREHIKRVEAVETSVLRSANRSM